MPRYLRYFLVVGGAIVSILLFLLASASENSALFDQHYPWLLGLNALMAAALLGLVTLLLTRLYRRHKRGEFGSKLMARLVLLFALIGILPGLVIYIVSVQFVSRSIESWFNVQVESALESGLTLGRTALDASLSDLSVKARNTALELADLASESSLVTRLSRLRDAQQEATILTGGGRIIATVGGQIGTLVPDLPNASMLRAARLTRAYAAIEGSADTTDLGQKDGAANGLRLRVVVTIPTSDKAYGLQNETYYLQLLQPVPAPLAVNAEALRAAYSEYQERSLARTGLRKIYIVTLTLTLLLAIFGAIAGAFLIAGDLAKPLLLLAEGTKAVAEGNLSPRPIVATSDELGTLTQSFNTMTRQLADARASVERNRTALENAKAYLESVLANMSAGVMVLDAQFKLVTCNESVERILQRDFDQHVGNPLSGIAGLEPLADAIIKAFSEQDLTNSADDEGDNEAHWQCQIEVPRDGGASLGEGNADGQNITLLARGSHLPVANGTGYIVVFDDITDVISAQRSIAWGEVARRLAHEIKNPLTPIQLSAERLQMKLEDKLAPPEAAVLTKSTSTIVNQVAAMKRMVDDFRDYAKTPPAVLTPLDLNALIEEILHLYVAGAGDIIHTELAAGLPSVMGDATQLRQVIHNLLQNAQDAVTEHVATLNEAPRIDVITEAIRYQRGDSEQLAVRLTIKDNGPGFAHKIMSRAFEPYVTSKPRGTGLGLPMVKKIIDEHGGRIDLQNRANGRGAKVSILLLKLAADDRLAEA